MVASAAYYLPLAHEGSRCVDAVKAGAARLGQSAALINVCYRDRQRNMKVKKDKSGGKPQRQRGRA